eukprot:scaffold2844_cov326-Pavlova_lutheri.AAC.14
MSIRVSCAKERVILRDTSGHRFQQRNTQVGPGGFTCRTRHIPMQKPMRGPSQQHGKQGMKVPDRSKASIGIDGSMRTLSLKRICVPSSMIFGHGALMREIP